MTDKKVQELNHGLYKIYWHRGGYSLASVGSFPSGKRWLAPTNWIGFLLPEHQRTIWREVKKVKLLYEKTL